MSNSYYLTTTLPYVNDDPHIGFALEIVQADTIARLRSKQGYGVFFNFGTDEHGQKIYQKAIDSQKDPQTYVDEYAIRFDKLKIALNLSYNNFIRTTDSHHIKSAQEFWKRCDQNGFIYKKNYKIKYCVGCELEKTDSELENGLCPLHPNRELEIREEENYFFKFKAFQEDLLKLYKENPDFVVPQEKMGEIESFVKSGLKDFSISRLKAKMPWGIEVPTDPDHVMYVWFDALVNYVSAIGWPDNTEKFNKWWPVTQFAGKDNLRQQSAMWQSMLKAAGIPFSKQIFIHGFITSNGQKISKSLGNVVNPYELVEKYGTDPVRYYLLAKIHPFEDSDFTYDKFENAYQSDLANGLGNLVARVAKLAENSDFEFGETKINENIWNEEWAEALEDYRFDIALSRIWLDIKITDQHLNQEKPWLRKDKHQLQQILQYEIDMVRQIATRLQIFLPETAEKILNQFTGPKIVSGEPLFPRLK